MDVMSVILCLILSVIFLGFIWALVQSYGLVDVCDNEEYVRVVAPEGLDYLQIALTGSKNKYTTLIVTDRLTEEECRLLQRMTLHEENVEICTSEEMEYTLKSLLDLQNSHTSSILKEEKKEQ